MKTGPSRFHISVFDNIKPVKNIESSNIYLYESWDNNNYKIKIIFRNSNSVGDLHYSIHKMFIRKQTTKGL